MYLPPNYVILKVMKLYKNLVAITSQSEIIKLDKEHMIDDYSIISFRDEIESYWDGLDRYDHIDIVFDDINYKYIQEPYDNIFPQADDIAKFIIESIKKGKKILCKCSYGQSRSAGCAAAILEYYYGEGSLIFKDDNYHPNMIVFNKTLIALLKQFKPYLFDK